MSIQKIATLKGQIDCPYCFSLLQWDDVEDVKIFNGNKYVVCPQCGKNIYLDAKKDYWIEPNNSSSESDDSSSNSSSNEILITEIEFINNDDIITCSHTFDEIKELIDNHKNFIAYYTQSGDKIYLYLYSYSSNSNQICFAHVNYSNVTGNVTDPVTLEFYAYQKVNDNEEIAFVQYPVQGSDS